MTPTLHLKSRSFQIHSELAQGLLLQIVLLKLVADHVNTMFAPRRTAWSIRESVRRGERLTITW